MARAPLEGIRVFDLTQWMVGPWASMQLGALGADVIHIEQPNVAWESVGAGVPPTINGTSIGYIAWNMNKRGLSLDLKSTEDRQTAYELLRTCDVFLLNMRPGVSNRLGVDYETVAEINPRIIYCSVTGWGESGPMSKDPGADTQVQYVTGFATGTGVPDGEDEIYRHFTQMDGNAGNYAAQAILMALVARKRTGRGQRVDVSMLRAGSALQTVRIGEYLSGGYQAQRLGSAAQSTAPDRAFLCDNLRYVGISVTSEAEWRALCEQIGQPELADDERFRTNSDRVERRAELDQILEPVFGGMPAEYWVMRLTEANVPVGYPMDWPELRHHEQVLANDYLVDAETAAWGTVTTGGPVWHLSATPQRWFGTPFPGQHDDDILEELKARRDEPAPAPAEVGRDAQ